MAQTPPPFWFNSSPPQAHQQYSISQQQTLPQTAVLPPSHPASTTNPGTTSTKRKYTRIFAIVLALALVVTFYFIWHSSITTTSPPALTQQNFGSSSSSTTTTSTNSSPTSNGDIQAYIVGAVKHPGVYALPAGARVFQLLQAAGGPLPNANLVALNLAAKLNDGQEVYVTIVGEMPPTYSGGVPGPVLSGTGTVTSNTGTTGGQLVNINTASVDEMRQSLHISSTTAQNIVNFRSQHGPYTSVNQLLQVVSRSIYDKIKGLVTV